MGIHGINVPVLSFLLLNQVKTFTVPFWETLGIFICHTNILTVEKVQMKVLQVNIQFANPKKETYKPFQLSHNCINPQRTMDVFVVRISLSWKKLIYELWNPKWKPIGGGFKSERTWYQKGSIIDKLLKLPMNPYIHWAACHNETTIEE